MTASSFGDLSLEAAKSFLQSVVVVDDEAYLDGRELTNSPTKMNKPGRGASLSSKGSAETAGKVKNTLNAKVLIDKFANDGLVCAVLKPASKREGIKTKVDKATQRADIVILDWKINASYGDKTLEMIQTILSSDSHEEDRIRLISIYTGESELFNISQRVKDLLSEIYDGDVIVSDDKYCIDAGPTRIVLFSKSRVGLPDEHISRVVEIDELPSKMILEFSCLYSGLLTNTAMAALGEIRAITHRILGKFSGCLDEAYLNHRALTSPTEEAELHVIPLISDEIQDALVGRDVHRFLSEKAIELWVKEKSLDITSLAARMGNVPEESALSRLIFTLKKGVEASRDHESGKYSDTWYSKINKLSKGNAKNERSHITKCFFENDANAIDADRSFSILTSVRTRYEAPAPQLQLGTLIAKEGREETEFFLCVQPSCDCVRLPSTGRDFIFLKLDKNTDAPDLVVREKDDQFLELKVDYSPYHSIHIALKPKQGSGVIIAKEHENSWVFMQSPRKKLHWIAELKPAHAQRIANNYAAKISRVGLTESEWLRRGA